MQQERAPIDQSDRPWYFDFYKTIGLSVILDDWEPTLLEAYDTKEWVDLVASAGVNLAALQAKCHAGMAYYDTEIDHLHAGLDGRDAFGEQVASFHDRGIKVFANVSLIFDERLFKLHPEWRLRNKEGKDCKEARFVLDEIRAGVLCINTPYREFAKRSLEAFARKYPVDLPHLDMLFTWTEICYCQSCRAQYLQHSGGDVPGGTDSADYPAYVRWRNERLYSFAEEMITAFKTIRPEAAATFNSPRPHLANPHMPVEMANLADMVGGDPVQDDSSPAGLVYSSSAWANMKPDRAALMCIGRWHRHEAQHAGMRTTEELEISTMVAAAFNHAVMLIDIPRPEGTLYRSVYERYTEVFAFLDKATPYLGGDRMRCVALYASEDTRRHLYETSSGVMPQDKREAIEHISGLKEIFRSLTDQHVPIDVITKLNLGQLDEYSVVILPDTLLMSDAEVEAVREYVAEGGNLLALRYSSLSDEDGRERGNFALADVFGVDYLGRTVNDETYLDVDPELCREAELPDDMEVKVDAQALVGARDGTTVSAKIVMPYTDRKFDAYQWVSAAGNPPGVRTDSPAIVWNTFGRGRSCYLSARVNAMNDFIGVRESRQLVGALAQRLIDGDSPLKVDAPPWLVATVVRQPGLDRIVCHMVNAQPVVPVIPLSDIDVSIRLEPGDAVESVHAGFEQEAVDFSQTEDRLAFTVPSVPVYAPVAIQLRSGDA